MLSLFYARYEVELELWIDLVAQHRNVLRIEDKISKIFLRKFMVQKL